jgi:outer membrane receptor protein involved in Fe transport
MKIRSKHLAALAALLLGFSTIFMFGQGITTGSISGTVQDPQQAVVAGANVTAVQQGTNARFSAVSNSVGAFTLRGLPVGEYEITIEAPNFTKVKVGNVSVSAGQQTSIGTQSLKLGGTETVVVEGGVAPLVQTDTMQIGQAFETKKIADLPIGNGFDFVALLTPGVAPAGDAAFSNNNGADISSNGQRGRGNNFQIDGQTNNDTSIGGPIVFFGNQDAIAEVQVLTNYSAEYGRNAGSVINYVTKSGTNAWHGTAYEYYQGNWADSFANQEKSPLFGFCQPGQAEGTVTDFTDPSGCTNPVLPRLVDHRYGGTLGAPILRDKLWFFVSGHRNTIRGAATPTSSAPFLTPTPTGISQLETLFPGSAAVAVLRNIGPTAVAAGNPIFQNTEMVDIDGDTVPDAEFGQISRTVPAPFDDWEGTARVDYQLSSKDRFFGRYVIQDQLFGGIGVPQGPLNAAQAIAEGSFVDLPARTHQVGLDWSRSWSPSFLNQVRYAYSRADVGFEGGAFGGCTRSAITNCPTGVQFGDGTLAFGLANNMPQGRKIINTQVQDNASWQRGKHLLKFGGEYGRQRQPNVFLPNVNGVYTFPSFLDFMNGTNAAVNLTIGSPSIHFVENQGAFYVQDDWKVKDNFTFTLGLRYEVADQAINVLHDLTVARESNPATALWDQSLPVAQRTVPAVPVDKNNFAPVIGFAWTPKILPGLFGENKTVIRGGFRISYEPEFYNMFSNVATSAPSVNSITGLECTNCLPASGLGSDVQTALSAFLPPGVDPGFRNQTTVAPNFHSPYTEQWNLGIQRELGSKAVAEIRYVGNHGVGLFQSISPNVALNPLIDAGFGSLIPADRVPCDLPDTPGFALGYNDCSHRKVLQRANTAFSIYHGLQTRFDIRNWHGVAGGLTYTYSRNIDNSSEVFSTIAGGNTLSFSQNPFDGNRSERAVSGLDYPHIASVYLLYELPWYKNQTGVLGHILGGWQINPVWRFTSGQPYTIIQTRFASVNDVANDTISAGICDPSGVFSTLFSACRPFLNNPAAPLDSVGICRNAALPNCDLVDYDTINLEDPNVHGVPMNPADAHWIINDSESQAIFGSPFNGVPRNTHRGQTINNVNLSLMKNIKVTERIGLQLRGVAYNVFNRQFRGNPDPLADDGSFAGRGGSFANNFFNPSGANQSNSVFSGIDRRRIEVGAKVTF